MGVSQERKCLLNIVSQKLISNDFCTSFVLHKVKKTFGGSKWKLIELTRVSRYLAYVSVTRKKVTMPSPSQIDKKNREQGRRTFLVRASWEKALSLSFLSPPSFVHVKQCQKKESDNAYSQLEINQLINQQTNQLDERASWEKALSLSFFSPPYRNRNNLCSSFVWSI